MLAKYTVAGARGFRAACDRCVCANADRDCRHTDQRHDASMTPSADSRYVVVSG